MRHTKIVHWEHIARKYGIDIRDTARMWIAEFYERQFPDKEDK
jgi:hypothetical protein